MHLEFTYALLKRVVSEIQAGDVKPESALYTIHMLLQCNLGAYQAIRFDQFANYSHKIRN